MSDLTVNRLSTSLPFLRKSTSSLVRYLNQAQQSDVPGKRPDFTPQQERTYSKIFKTSSEGIMLYNVFSVVLSIIQIMAGEKSGKLSKTTLQEAPRWNYKGKGIFSVSQTKAAAQEIYPKIRKNPQIVRHHPIGQKLTGHEDVSTFAPIVYKFMADEGFGIPELIRKTGPSSAIEFGKLLKQTTSKLMKITKQLKNSGWETTTSEPAQDVLKILKQD